MIESIATFEELKQRLPHLQDVEGDRMILAWGDQPPNAFVVSCQASTNEPAAIQRFDARMSEAWRQARDLFAD
ncbi:MAG: hypothetical protein IPK79_02975 [Vampirovibrionales bacterium]|nr:hypothetical protein [Vampirovibrionales bacterium]